MVLFILSQYFTYIAASHKKGTIYTGMTNNLVRRIWEHKEGLVEGFTKRYDVKLLVYYEVREAPLAAIQREKQIKEWKRSWKIRLIEECNPQWRDLYDEIARWS